MTRPLGPLWKSPGKSRAFFDSLCMTGLKADRGPGDSTDPTRSRSRASTSELGRHAARSEGISRPDWGTFWRARELARDHLSRPLCYCEDDGLALVTVLLLLIYHTR